MASVIALAGVCAGTVAAGQTGTGGGGDSRFDQLMHEGFALHQQARFGEAIPILEQARKLEPGDYFANLLLGIDLLRVGRAEAALPRLEAAAAARPGEEIPEDYLGEAQAGLGHNGAAATAYQRAVSLSKGDEDALLAWAGFSLERFRQIEERLRATPEGVAVARRIEAVAAGPEKAGAQGARRSAEAALAIDPHRRSALRTEAAIAMEARDYEGAIPTLRKLVSEEPGNRKPQVELGRALAQTGHDADAAALLEPALAGGYADEKGALHALLARVLLRLNRPDEAAKAEAEARRLSDAFQEKSIPANEAPK